MTMPLCKIIIRDNSNQLHINLNFYLGTHSSQRYKRHFIKPNTIFLLLFALNWKYSTEDQTESKRLCLGKKKNFVIIPL